MRRLTFAFAFGCIASSGARAQQVPGRDLLEFPIGLMVEGPALATLTGDGLRNPAATVLGDSLRLRLTALSLFTGSDQGVAAQGISAAVRLPEHATVGLSVVRAAVGNVLQTDTDPQSLGEIPYNTILVSATAARRNGGHVVSGVAVRYRTGQVGDSRKSAIGLDGGVIVDGITSHDIRLGVSTFLWRPADPSHEETTFAGAVDGRLFGRDSTAGVRLGYSYAHTERFEREHFAFTSGRLRVLEVRAGIANAVAFGKTDTRLRLGLGLHYARYLVGVAREDNAAGLAPTYQFMLSTVLQ